MKQQKPTGEDKKPREAQKPFQILKKEEKDQDMENEKKDLAKI